MHDAVDPRDRSLAGVGVAQIPGEELKPVAADCGQIVEVAALYRGVVERVEAVQHAHATALRKELVCQV